MASGAGAAHPTGAHAREQWQRTALSPRRSSLSTSSPCPAGAYGTVTPRRREEGGPPPGVTERAREGSESVCDRLLIRLRRPRSVETLDKLSLGNVKLRGHRKERWFTKRGLLLGSLATPSSGIASCTHSGGERFAGGFTGEGRGQGDEWSAPLVDPAAQEPSLASPGRVEALKSRRRRAEQSDCTARPKHCFLRGAREVRLRPSRKGETTRDL